MNDNYWPYFYCPSCRHYFSRYCSTKNCPLCGSKSIMNSKGIMKVTETLEALQNKARR